MKSRPAAVLCPIQKRPVIIIMVREAVRKGRFLHRISLWNLTKCRCPWRLKINLDSQCGCSSCSQSKINHIMEIIRVPIHSVYSGVEWAVCGCTRWMEDVREVFVMKDVIVLYLLSGVHKVFSTSGTIHSTSGARRLPLVKENKQTSHICCTCIKY